MNFLVAYIPSGEKKKKKPLKISLKLSIFIGVAIIFFLFVILIILRKKKAKDIALFPPPFLGWGGRGNRKLRVLKTGQDQYFDSDRIWTDNLSLSQITSLTTLIHTSISTKIIILKLKLFDRPTHHPQKNNGHGIRFIGNSNSSLCVPA